MPDDSTPGIPPDWETALVTGGMGFIGSNLTLRLLGAEVRVHVVDAELPAYGANELNLNRYTSGITRHTADIRDEQKLDDIFEATKPDVVFHLAAQVSRPISMSDPNTDVSINCRGTINVLESTQEHCPGAPVTFTSSQAVYGTPESTPLTEETSTAPVDVYGANKSAGESYCRVYSRAHDLDTTIVRLTNAYGPRAQLENPKYGVINKFIRNALNDDILTVYDPGTMQRDFVYIDDVVTGLIAATCHDASDETFHVE
jgi:UDP-glucose 4-epimerase